MKNKQFIAVSAGVIAATIMWSSAKLPENFSLLLPVQGLRLMSLSSGADQTSPSVVAQEAWAVFEQYLEYAKNHDAEGVMSVSHQKSETCSDPSSWGECVELMDTGYSLGSSMHKEDFVHVWSDAKQIILATDYSDIDLSSPNAYGRTRSIIYFSRDKSGTPKLIGFNPNEIIFLQGNGLSREEASMELDAMSLDSDKDSLPDIKELCQSSAGTKIEGCVATDPYDPDTNGDGWWDSIEALLK